MPVERIQGGNFFYMWMVAIFISKPLPISRKLACPFCGYVENRYVELSLFLLLLPNRLMFHAGAKNILNVYGCYKAFTNLRA